MKDILKITGAVFVLLFMAGCEHKVKGRLFINDDSAVVTQGESAEIDAVANDVYDPVAGEFFAHIILKGIIGAPTKGTAVVNDTNNTIVYTANAGTSGNDTFVYSAYSQGKKNSYDSSGASTGLVDFNTTEDNATVTVHITEVKNHRPIANTQTVHLDCDTLGTLSVDITLSASDSDGDTLTYSTIGYPPLHGSLSAINSNNIVTYTADTDYNVCNRDYEDDMFTFKVNDGLQDSNDATITIVPINK